MRVIVLTPYYPPMISGAGRYVSDLSEAWVGDGNDVTVLVLGGSREDDCWGPVIVQAVVGRPIVPTSLIAALTAWKLHRSQPFDVVVGAPAHPSGFLAWVLSRVLRRPVLVVAMGEEIGAATRNPLSRRLVHRTVRGAARTVCISTWTLQQVLRLGGRPERCVRRCPAIDAAPFLHASTDHCVAFRARHGLSKGRLVLTTARLEARKGHDTVMRAIAGLPSGYDDVQYLIIGEGDPRALQELAHSLHLEHRVTVVERLSDRDLAYAYVACDVFAMLSRPGPAGEVEGFGIVYLEAAAAGRPCLAGNEGGCLDAVDDGHTGLCVDPRDVDAACEALRRLLSDTELAEHLGRSGRERVLSEFQREDFRIDVTALLHATRADSGETTPRSRE